MTMNYFLARLTFTVESTTISPLIFLGSFLFSVDVVWLVENDALGFVLIIKGACSGAYFIGCGSLISELETLD